ncbi:thiolase family protein [Pseudohoeflea coraliihabitans]|uniref:Thiolase family protein n=1 Tax=Pseudohoeflea coraliihabitans TaxID=2860393 RepID=A0ABS6WRN9_9HYPH|nr:thiolase family protein [Pseudohoeflea sp. DP4N28-3]MBW3098313.1 thiolase family protein [Pseudohoeflea sp. DP4N28-3]
MTVNPIILGGDVVPFRRYRDGSGLRDWIAAAAAGALANAGLESRDIDAVIVASETDFLSLQLVPGPLVLDELGITGVPVMRVESGGASGGNALRAGVMHILSGLARRVLVIGFEHAAGHLAGDDVRLLYGLSFDADLEGWAGATATMLYALSIQDHMHRHGTTAAQMAAVSVKNHGNAQHNKWAHKPMRLTIDDVLASPMVSTPYRRLDCSLISDGAAALVLAHPDAAPGHAARRCSRIVASACATDHIRLGDRPEPGHFTGKTRAMQAACAQAGIDQIAAAFDVAEVYDSYTGAELQAIEALGLCPPGEAAARCMDGEFDADGRLPVNLSGGLLGQGGAPGAVGLAQAITIARLLEGRYWSALQRDRAFRRGLVDCHAGVGTVNVVHILEGAPA